MEPEDKRFDEILSHVVFATYITTLQLPTLLRNYPFKDRLILIGAFIYFD